MAPTLILLGAIALANIFHPFGGGDTPAHVKAVPTSPRSTVVHTGGTLTPLDNAKAPEVVVPARSAVLVANTIPVQEAVTSHVFSVEESPYVNQVPIPPFVDAPVMDQSAYIVSQGGGPIVNDPIWTQDNYYPQGQGDAVIQYPPQNTYYVDSTAYYNQYYSASNYWENSQQTAIYSIY